LPCFCHASTLSIVPVLLQPTSACNIQFTELFKAGPVNLKVLPFSVNSNEAGKQFIANAARLFNMSYSFLKPSEASILVERDPLFSDINVLLTFHSGQRALRDIPCSFYMQRKQEFYASLQPVDDIQASVDSLLNDKFRNKVVIGVHMRTHDKEHDWAIVPPSPQSGAHSASEFGEGATGADFVRTLGGIVRYWSAHNAADQLRFFITSNSREEKLNAMAEVPNAIALDGNYNRSSSDSVRMAFTEWLLLSKTSLLINTYGSSFAVEAAYASEHSPVVGILDHGLMHHLDVHLPYCGLLQFARAYSSAGSKNSYQEGTFDQRQVKSVVFMLEESQLLSEWGFSEPVYALTTV
jgi:hypothetical protein